MEMNKKMTRGKPGWYRESERHALASRGVPTKVKGEAQGRYDKERKGRMENKEEIWDKLSELNLKIARKRSLRNDLRRNTFEDNATKCEILWGEEQDLVKERRKLRKELRKIETEIDKVGDD